MDELPLILLGIRTAWREDADTTAAELVYGSTLWVPGEFVAVSGPVSAPAPSSGFLHSLQESMRNARPPPALFHSQPNTQVPSALATASHVYVRHDAQRSPLQRPYDCLLYTSPSPRDLSTSRMPSSA